MKKISFKRVLVFAMVICIMASITVPTFAYDVLGTAGQNEQRTTSATIDESLSGSIEMYKIDFTNAEKDGVWNRESYVSTGIYDQEVNNKLINDAVRAGDDDTVSDLGNEDVSNGYAVKGVEFTYLRVADIVTYTENEDGAAKVMVLYGFDKTASADLLSAIGLTVDDRYVKADGIEDNSAIAYFESDVLVNALRVALADNATTVKNSLENYIATNGGTAMALTDSNGYTAVDDLPLGLYLIVETKVPEMITNTVNPFFVSLPMTTVDGTNSDLADDSATTDSTDGGATWLYDVTLYPKNESGIPTLEKTVRESMDDTGENNGTTAPTEGAIADGYKHYATASSGDTLDYQIISTLPSITSKASQLSVYTFTDVLSAGLTYTKGDVKLEWFRDEACTDPIATWTETDETQKFAVDYIPSETDDAQDTTMTITMTDAGLAEINESTAVWNAPNQVRRGYSDCTLRITYTAILDSNATVNFGEMGNDNDVVLQWRRSSTSYLDVLRDDAHVYTYGLELTKLFEGEDGNPEVDGDFNEVKFVVWNASDGYWVQAELNAEEGIYYVTNHLVEGGVEGHDDEAVHADLTAQEAATEAHATEFVPVAAEDNSNGKVIIKGLEDDEYIITEIRTSNGYALLKNHIDVVITATETEGLCDVYDGTDILGVIQNDPRYASIVNADNVDTVLGLGGAAADNGTITGENIPQTQLSHHLLTTCATVDGNDVTMLADEDGESANALAPLIVVNTHTFDLPLSGEFGVILLPLCGMIGICVCVALLFVLKKKRK